MTNRLTWLAMHVLLLALASTCFTVVTGIGNGRFQWEYFRYASQSGWGQPYQFHYSLPVVLTYLAAYATGVGAYRAIWRSGSPVIGLTGLGLCALGLASFIYESTHWFHQHYGSWIASAPIALLVLAVIAGVQEYWRRTDDAGMASEVAMQQPE